MTPKQAIYHMRLLLVIIEAGLDYGPAIEVKPVPTVPTHVNLTPRQFGVLRCLRDGFSTKDTARHLGIAIGTCKSHTNAILRAYNVNSVRQLIALLGKNEP